MLRAMARVLALLLAALAQLLPGAPALAQPGARVISSVSWVEEWDPASRRWVRVDDSPATIRDAAWETTTSVTREGTAIVTETVSREPVRFIARPQPPARPPLASGARYGPFRVLDERRAALVGATDAASPAAFAAMLAAHPGLQVIEFVDAAGTSNDLANLAVGRAIRAAGLSTHVPDGGSARSGAVELFLAGAHRSAEPGALFAVHSWRDERGREPDDFAPDAPENRLYLDYYAEMGMSEGEARAFYDMTNSVSNAEALWLTGSDMARWIAPERSAPRSREMPVPAAPLRLAGLDDRLPIACVAPLPWPRFAYAGLLDSLAAFP
ncbi:MAG: alpha/beta hydrolase [Porphyrobacter sp.]|nr:alpha/beta hydrolase [Porphyrobacter sp.]